MKFYAKFKIKFENQTFSSEIKLCLRAVSSKRSKNVIKSYNRDAVLGQGRAGSLHKLDSFYGSFSTIFLNSTKTLTLRN